MSEKGVSEERKQEEESLNPSQTKKSFTEPTLTFTEPRLTKNGDATKITAGFFGTFSPQ